LELDYLSTAPQESVMASWIVHLRIADKILEHLPDLDAGQFAIGNVAPDSGVPDERWEVFDPPPEVTHFLHKETPDATGICQDMKFYDQYMQGQVDLQEDPQRFSFLLGYFFHLITDNLWIDRIWHPTKKSYHSDFENNPEFIWEVKKDWYGLDFTYVRSHPDSLFWSAFIGSRYDEEYLIYFPPKAIADKIEYIKIFYQRTDEDVDNRLRLTNHIYLNEAEMALFVDGAYRDLLRIYQAIWERGVQTAGLTSAVELLM
jgi:hypothetical protein